LLIQPGADRDQNFEHDTHTLLPWFCLRRNLLADHSHEPCLLSFVSSPRYKCHKECIANAPASCGFSEVKFRRAFENNDFQNALGKCSCRRHALLMNVASSLQPIPVHCHGNIHMHVRNGRTRWNNIRAVSVLLVWDGISPTSSAPGSPALNPQMPSYQFNPSICISESTYSSE
jgi:hypothetical protein